MRLVFGDMKTALCFTPDLDFFRPAVFTAASLLAQGDADAFDIFIVCEARDVAPGFENLDPALRRRISLKIVDFSVYDAGLREKGRFSRAVFRRLFLDRVMEETYPRLVSIDADMRIARPGLSRLADLDLGGKPLAAAIDMISLMDFGGPLAEEFRGYRRALGLDLETPYFNAGLMTIDRSAWRERRLTERVVEALREAPERYPFMEQDCLNSILKGDFAPLSPRYNFMGDFFLLDLETTLQPIVLHFVNSPKPWNYDLWEGEARFARDYRRWFAASPWPDWPTASPPTRALKEAPPSTPERRRFAERLLAFLKAQSFVDGPLPAVPLP